MKKIIIATLTLFLTLPAIGAYNAVGPTDEVTWPFESVKNTLEGSSLSTDEKSLFAYGLKNILETQKTLTFSVTDFIGICLNTYATLYKESYKNNGDLYAKKCSNISIKLVDEYNKIQQQNPSNNINSTYPKDKASYFSLEECLSENPDSSVQCVKNDTGAIWAVAEFATMKKSDKTINWWTAEEAWAQMGTNVKLTISNTGIVYKYDERLTNIKVCEYNYKSAVDYKSCVSK